MFPTYFRLLALKKKDLTMNLFYDLCTFYVPYFHVYNKYLLDLFFLELSTTKQIVVTEDRIKPMHYKFTSLLGYIIIKKINKQIPA